MIAQKENEEIFFIDTKGGKTSSSMNSSTKIIKKNLKIDQILKPESAYTIGRTHQPKGSKAEEAIIAKKTKALERGNKNLSASAKGSVTTASASIYDAWADETNIQINTATTKQVRHTSIVPAVQVPETANSYNPSREEHLAHLECLESLELQRLARNEIFKERLPMAQVSVSSASVASYDLVAVANRKLALGEVSDDEDGGSLEASCLTGSTQVNRKKTLKDRKRQLRHKETIAQHTARRLEKNLNASIDRVPLLLAEIKNIQQTRQSVDEILVPVEEQIRKQRRANKIKKRLVLEPLAIKMPEELPASMRQLAPEGNLVTDRFRSLIERGVIEATTHKILSTEVKSNYRKQGMSLKPRIKMVEKFSYKDFK